MKIGPREPPRPSRVSRLGGLSVGGNCDGKRSEPLPIEIEIDLAKRLVTAKAHRVVRLQDVLDYFDALATSGAMPSPKLFDARQLDSRLSEEDMLVLAERVRANAVHDPRGAIAAVVTTPEARTAVQRFRELGGARRPVEIFATLEGARAWLVSR